MFISIRFIASPAPPSFLKKGSEGSLVKKTILVGIIKSSFVTCYLLLASALALATVASTATATATATGLSLGTSQGLGRTEWDYFLLHAAGFFECGVVCLRGHLARLFCSVRNVKIRCDLFLPGRGGARDEEGTDDDEGEEEEDDYSVQ